jgi:hypothetical protein
MEGGSLMSMWSKERTPDEYCLGFHGPLKAGPGQYAIATGTEEECRREWRRFHAFKATLRRNPSHPSAQLLRMYDVRLRLEQDDLNSDIWYLYCTVRAGKFIAEALMREVFPGAPSGG